MTDVKNMQDRLDDLERLFHNSATYGVSLFQTLSLEKDDDGANAALLETLRKSLEEQFPNKDLVEKHLTNIKEIRKSVLSDPNTQELLEQRISNIREKISMDLIIHEDNLRVEGDFDPFDIEK
ncbi:MAG: hypothetical protein K0T99_04505 [Alphaproteobacteria bacterium]|nr:hypothetical protein [Alphaproteobacteria bacterium]